MATVLEGRGRVTCFFTAQENFGIAVCFCAGLASFNTREYQGIPCQPHSPSNWSFALGAGSSCGSMWSAAGAGLTIPRFGILEKPTLKTRRV
jgi:hypothetical protein